MMNSEHYRQQFKVDDSPGWQAIDNQLYKVYGDTEPRHYPPLCGLHYVAGGTDPIDGASVYDNSHQNFHRHIISYGMSELYYDESKAGGEFSKWGFEFTFRLTPFSDDQEEDPIWAIQVMNNLARYVFTSGKWFEENHFIPANGPIRLNTKTEITGFVIALDPELGKIETAHGEVSFLQLVGITDAEVNRLMQSPNTNAIKEFITDLQKDNPLLITDLDRK
ncbi:suppressor of fused domain protein [Sphingobacterium deserti]|uniref:Riboflavin biosynthesis protein n=1 Tax=Sphingobacterium deserti TaxID=1229276 RepID=A0A0B8SYQ3_9SPHI|nr:suppressor of fused domain protein [Sphingobacterium deserti]KGE12517.1 riboflavin biosynthesis protein [Sphingobacterium deserti]